MLGLFRVKNHDFTPKNNIFSNLGGPLNPPLVTTHYMQFFGQILGMYEPVFPS
jgi:hypothetical protein